MSDNIYKQSTFDFGSAVSQLFSQPGGRDFMIRLVLWTSVLIGLCFVLIGKPYIAMMGDLLEASWAINQGPQDEEAILQMYAGMTKYLGILAIACLLLWAVYASAEAALHKRILRGVDHGAFPLRFGADELRVMGAQLMVYLMFFGLYLLLIFGTIILSIFAGAIGSFSAALGVIVGLLCLAGFIFLFWFMFYFAIRIAPASALTVKNQRLMIMDGWAITKKRAGSLCLAYLFVFIIGYVVISVIQMFAITSILDEGYFSLITGLSEENPREIFEQAAAKFKQPGTLILLVFCSVAYVIASVIWWLSVAGVANYAVQWWHEDDSNTTGFTG